MRAEFVNAFFTPVMDVWRRELGAELTFREAEAADGPFTTEELSAVVRASGRLRGSVFYELPRATCLALASALRHAKLGELDEEAYAAIHDLAERVVEGARQVLAQAGYRVDLTPPVLLPGGASVTVVQPQLRAHFHSALGVMSVRIGLAETSD